MVRINTLELTHTHTHTHIKLFIHCCIYISLLGAEGLIAVVVPVACFTVYARQSKGLTMTQFRSCASEQEDVF